MALLNYMLNMYEKIDDIPEHLKPFYTDSDTIYQNQIKFPCIFCKKLILDYQTSFSDISSHDVEGRKEFYHSICKPEGFRLADISNYMPLYSKPQDEPKKHVFEQLKKMVSQNALDSMPDDDQKSYDFGLVVLSLDERPKAKREICNDTDLPMNTVSWRIYDHDVETPEFTEKGKKARHSNTFIKVGNKSGKIRGFVYALKDKRYSKEVLRECREKYGITFFKWFPK